MKKFILILILALCLFTQNIFSHPHMSMWSQLEFVWDKANLSGVYVEWTFDYFFSADIIAAWDENQDGIFNERETNNVYNNAFINLEKYYYFTFIRQGDVRTNPPKVQEFKVWQKNGQMFYRFFVDLSEYKAGEINIAIYDYTYFCDISYLSETPVKLTYDENFVKPKYSIEENKKYPVYYNPLGAIDDTTIYYEYKKGLQTYYPKEIKITYE